MKYYTLYEAAVMLGIQVRTARGWIQSGKLIAEKDPNSHRYRVSEDQILKLKNTEDKKKW